MKTGAVTCGLIPPTRICVFMLIIKYDMFFNESTINITCDSLLLERDIHLLTIPTPWILPGLHRLKDVNPPIMTISRVYYMTPFLFMNQ